MTETADRIAEQAPPQVKIKSLQDLGEKIVESNPSLWGLESKFSIFKTSKDGQGKLEYVTEERDGEKSKVIDQINFLKWTKLQLSDNPEDLSSITNEKKQNLFSRIFKRNIQAPKTQITRMNYGNWTGHVDDMIKFTEYDSTTGLRFKRKEYQEAMEKMAQQAKRTKLQLAA